MKKKSILLVSLLMIGLISFGQTQKEEIELFQSIFGMEKKAIVSDIVKLEGEKAKGFWTIYDEYETARKEHGQKRMVSLQNYIMNYENMDDKRSEETVDDMIKLGNEYNKLIQKYYKQINKAFGAKTAGQFYQLETYFQSVIRLTIMEQVPFIGELDLN